MQSNFNKRRKGRRNRRPFKKEARIMLQRKMRNKEELKKRRIKGRRKGR